MKEVGSASHLPKNRTLNFTTKDDYIKYNGRLEGRCVQVQEKTIENLIFAGKIINEVHDLLPFGSGNLFCDIFLTKGESFLRANYAMAKGGGSIVKHANMCIQAQAANCSGHADIAYLLANQKKTDLPIGRATSDVDDHAFVVIGDQRVSEHETVVVDAWPGLATPFLLKNVDKSLINKNPTIVEWATQNLPEGEGIVKSVEAIPLKKIKQFFKKFNVPCSEGELYEYIINEDKNLKNIHDVFTSMDNPRINYLSKSTLRKFDADEVNESTYITKMSGYKKSLKARDKYGSS